VISNKGEVLLKGGKFSTRDYHTHNVHRQAGYTSDVIQAVLSVSMSDVRQVCFLTGDYYYVKWLDKGKTLINQTLIILHVPITIHIDV
jgi:hypothetical protein